jgi:hypothetical protein
MYTKSHITFELQPIAQNVNSIADDNWLENNSLDLIEDKFIASHPAARGATYHCETLQFHCVEDRLLLTAREGEVELFSDDVIQLGTTSYQVKIQQTTAPSKIISRPVTPPLSTMTPSENIYSEDIWSGEAERLPTVKTADPFSLSRTTQQPISRIDRSAIAGSMNHDPLDFLYQNKTAANNYDPNILLPSLSVPHESQLALTSTPPVPTPHFLDQAPMDSPMDRLDQYLSFDDERYYDVRGN